MSRAPAANMEAVMVVASDAWRMDSSTLQQIPTAAHSCWALSPCAISSPRVISDPSLQRWSFSSVNTETKTLSLTV